MRMIALTPVILFCFSSGFAAAQTEVKKEDEKKAEVVIPPSAKVTCAIEGPSKYVAKLAEPDTSLFTLEIRDCRFRTDLAGVSSVRSELLIDLMEESDFQRCQNFRIAQLFELRSATEDFSWPAHRTVVSDIAVENLSESVKDLSYFRIHDDVAGEVTKLRDVMASNSGQPTYDDLFWGEIIIFEEPDGGLFSRLLKEKLPQKGREDGKPDYELKLNLQMFPARGLCSYQEEISQGGQEPVKQTFSKTVKFDQEKSK